MRADGVGQDARFGGIVDAELDSKGALYISEIKRDKTGGYYYSGYAVRSVGRDGTVKTLYADPFDEQRGASPSLYAATLAIDKRDQLFVTSLSQTHLLGKDGTATALPFGQGGQRIVTSAAGVSYRITYATISRIEADGSATVLAGAETVVTPAAGSDVAAPVDGPGSSARFKFIQPETVVLDPAGNLYLADSTMIRKVTPQGLVSTLAGTTDGSAARDGAGSGARFINPHSMAYQDGQLLVIDKDTLRRVSLDGVVTTTATSLPTARVLRADGQGTLFVIFPEHVATLGADGKLTVLAGKPNLSETSVDGIGAAARLRLPQYLTADPSGNLYAIEQQTVTYRSSGPAFN
ncbi:hypothetical protein EJB06_31035, partial [Massilia atriviolacea]